ncbi:hypothetical protein ZWY2020_015241 [Hordeum vulgare]|nr:hypothetical protein ZWY2020_015241 [Hordeum vulgare]
MVAMGMDSTKRGVVWCAGLLVVAGLLIAVAAADADFCCEECRGDTDSLGGCVRRCRSPQLEVARPTNCVALCHAKPNFMACCKYVRRATPRLRRAGGESTTHEEEEEASGGAVRVLKAPAPAPCEVLCRDQPDWVAYQRCLDRCRWGACLRRALLHLELAGRESATHEQVLTAMAVRLSDACQDSCQNHAHYDWCVRRCRFGPHLRLAGGGGEPEEAGGGAVDVPQTVGQRHMKKKKKKTVAGARPMDSTDPCEGYCVEQTRYFPRPGQFYDCVEECHAGHGRLAGDGRNGILRRVEQEPVTTEDQVQLGSGGRNGIPPAAEAVAAQREAAVAAVGAQAMNTESCEAYCKRHARDFPPKYAACVRQCQSGGHPGDGASIKLERLKKDGEVHLLRRGTGKKIAIE